MVKVRIFQIFTVGLHVLKTEKKTRSLTVLEDFFDSEFVCKILTCIGCNCYLHSLRKLPHTETGMLVQMIIIFVLNDALNSIHYKEKPQQIVPFDLNEIVFMIICNSIIILYELEHTRKLRVNILLGMYVFFLDCFMPLHFYNYDNMKLQHSSTLFD